MNNKIIHLGTLTLLGFPLIGWLVLWVFDGPSMSEVLAIDLNFGKQILIGIASGVVFGWSAWLLIRSKMMVNVRTKYSVLIQQMKLTPFQMLYISLCAGIGEEIFFRGVIQPYLGIWITAIVFVGIHGYLNPFNWRLFVYGTYMTMAIAAIGYFAERFGLYSAMIAHAAIDMVLLYQMSKSEVSETIPVENSLSDQNVQ
jgi:uncharacterized protein